MIEEDGNVGVVAGAVADVGDHGGECDGAGGVGRLGGLEGGWWR